MKLAMRGSQPRESSPNSSSSMARDVSSGSSSTSASAATAAEAAAAAAAVLVVHKPGPHDVLLGRGGGTNNHLGNINFRKLVNEHKMRYLASSKIEKPNVAREVVELWSKMTPPGRFLWRKEEDNDNNASSSSSSSRKNNNTNRRSSSSSSSGPALWVVVPERKAREKASQCLRERTPEVLPYLRQLRDDQNKLTEQGLNAVQERLQHQRNVAAKKVATATAAAAAVMNINNNNNSHLPNGLGNSNVDLSEEHFYRNTGGVGVGGHHGSCVSLTEYNDSLPVDEEGRPLSATAGNSMMMMMNNNSNNNRRGSMPTMQGGGGGDQSPRMPQRSFHGGGDGGSRNHHHMAITRRSTAPHLRTSNNVHMMQMPTFPNNAGSSSAMMMMNNGGAGAGTNMMNSFGRNDNGGMEPGLVGSNNSMNNNINNASSFHELDMSAMQQFQQQQQQQMQMQQQMQQQMQMQQQQMMSMGMMPTMMNGMAAAAGMNGMHYPMHMSSMNPMNHMRTMSPVSSGGVGVVGSNGNTTKNGNINHHNIYSSSSIRMEHERAEMMNMRRQRNGSMPSYLQQEQERLESGIHADPLGYHDSIQNEEDVPRARNSNSIMDDNHGRRPDPESFVEQGGDEGVSNSDQYIDAIPVETTSFGNKEAPAVKKRDSSGSKNSKRNNDVVVDQQSIQRNIEPEEQRSSSQPYQEPHCNVQDPKTTNAATTTSDEKQKKPAPITPPQDDGDDAIALAMADTDGQLTLNSDGGQTDDDRHVQEDGDFLKMNNDDIHGEVTLDEYRKTLELYMKNNNIAVFDPNDAYDDQNDDDDDEEEEEEILSVGDFEDWPDVDPANNGKRRSNRVGREAPASRMVDRRKSGQSMMSCQTYKSNASSLSGLSLLSNMSMDENERHLQESAENMMNSKSSNNDKRRFSSTGSIMTDISDISHTLDGIDLDEVS